MTGKALGTSAYMSPEQWSGGRNVDHRTDLYALGVTAYAMATGRLPFTGPTPSAFMQQHQSEIPPRIEEINPAIPKHLVQVIYRLLAKDPADRHQTAGELLHDLDRIEQGRPPQIVYRFRKQHRLGLRTVAAIVGAAVVLVLAGVWGGQSTGDDQIRLEVKTVAAEARRLAATRDYDKALAVLKAGIARLAAHPRLVADLERLRDDYVIHAVREQQRIAREARDLQARLALAEVERLLALDHLDEALRRATEALGQYYDTPTATGLADAQQQARHRLADSTAQRNQRFGDHYQRALLLCQQSPPDLPNALLNLQATLREKPDPAAKELLQTVTGTVTEYRAALRQGQEALADGQQRGDLAPIRDALARFRKAQGLWSSTEAADLVAQAEATAAAIQAAAAATTPSASPLPPSTNRPTELWRFAHQVEAQNHHSEIVRVILPSYRLEQTTATHSRFTPGFRRRSRKTTVARRSYDLLDESGRQRVLALEVLASGQKTVRRYPGGNLATRLMRDLPPRYAATADYTMEFELSLDNEVVTNIAVRCAYACEDVRAYDWSALKATLARQINTVVDAHPVRITLRLVNYDYDRDFRLQLKTRALPGAMVPP
ncbi:hypothetical protein HQ590_05055 [bacterium]|nr:hypothetical protein [bacterium]